MFLLRRCCGRFADLDGSNRHAALAASVPHAFSITIFEEWMYWTDWNHKAIERANRFTGACDVRHVVVYFVQYMLTLVKREISRSEFQCDVSTFTVLCL